MWCQGWYLRALEMAQVSLEPPGPLGSFPRPTYALMRRDSGGAKARRSTPYMCSLQQAKRKHSARCASSSNTEWDTCSTVTSQGLQHIRCEQRIWQIPLAKKSRLTTFITSYSHYCFNKLAFGISYSWVLTVFFARKMIPLCLGRLEGAWWATQAALKRIEAARVTSSLGKAY